LEVVDLGEKLGAVPAGRVAHPRQLRGVGPLIAAHRYSPEILERLLRPLGSLLVHAGEVCGCGGGAVGRRLGRCGTAPRGDAGVACAVVRAGFDRRRRCGHGAALTLSARGESGSQGGGGHGGQESSGLAEAFQVCSRSLRPYRGVPSTLHRRRLNVDSRETGGRNTPSPAHCHALGGTGVTGVARPSRSVPTGATVLSMWQMMDLLYAHKKDMVAPEDALPGRDAYPYPLAREHLVLGTDMLGPDAPRDPLPWPEDAEELILAGGCFWGVERIAWQIPGVHTTSAGYAGGYTPHPTYEEV